MMRSDAPCIDNMLSYVRAALDKIATHISTMETQLKTERRRWKKPALYKTELCEHWRNKRKCMFGMKCWYAHGPHDLRPNSGNSSTMSCTTTGISGDETSPQSMYSMGVTEGLPAISAADGDVTMRNYLPDVPPPSTTMPQTPIRITSGTTSHANTAVPTNNDLHPSAVSYAQPTMCHGPPLAFGAPSQPLGLRPTFFVSFDGRVPFAAAPAPPIMAGGLHAGPPQPVPVSATTSTVAPTSNGGELLSLKPNDSTCQQLLGVDFFRSNNLHVNFGSSAFGMSGFGFATPPPTAFASSDNWMGTLASSFIIPSKNIWLHQPAPQ